jgi:hypothetical protein
MRTIIKKLSRGFGDKLLRDLAMANLSAGYEIRRKGEVHITPTSLHVSYIILDHTALDIIQNPSPTRRSSVTYNLIIEYPDEKGLDQVIDLLDRRFRQGEAA